MLIIAIPKSASTSLMSTLGTIHGVPGRQVFFPDAPLAEGFDVLGRYHSGVREINTTLAARFAGESAVFKQHLPPTPNNVAQLRNRKKVILLREPDAIVAAFRRARRRFLSVSMTGLISWQTSRRGCARQRRMVSTEISIGSSPAGPMSLSPTSLSSGTRSSRRTPPRRSMPSRSFGA